MGLSKLSPIRSDKISFIDYRGSLYFNKYKYRARLYHQGIYLSTFTWDSDEELQRRIKNNRRWESANIDVIKTFAEWRLNHAQGKNRTCTIRIENNIASIFSNDLDHLKTLEDLGCTMDYTEVENVIPEGVKYFKKEPKFKLRLHLRSKRVQEDFRKKLAEFVKRYEGTSTKFELGPALKDWLFMSPQVRWGGWRTSYCSSHFFINYNEESFITLFALNFNGMISKTYKLEKRPDYM